MSVCGLLEVGVIEPSAEVFLVGLVKRLRPLPVKGVAWGDPP